MNSILKKLLYCISIGTSFICLGQNLVPNPSFEEYAECPSYNNNLCTVNICTAWFGLTNNSSDYMNSCAEEYKCGVPYTSNIGFQYPRTGTAFAGIWILNSYGLNYREYIQTKLLNSLTPNKCYFITFYINLFNGLNYACNNVGLHLNNNITISTNTGLVLDLSPQVLKLNNPIIDDTLNWTQISAIYVADGGEEYITIGNFGFDFETDTTNTGNGVYPGAYYYIDDVSVIPIDSLNGMPAYAGADTLIAPGDSVFIGQEISNLNCTWRSLDGTVLATNTSGLYVQPSETTTYVVEQNLCGAISYDTVKVYVGYLGLNQPAEALEVGIMPNPNNGNFTIHLKNNIEIQALKLLDEFGRTVKILNEKNKHFELNLPKGMYFLELTTDNYRFLEKIVVN